MSAIQPIAYACGLGAVKDGSQYGPDQLLEAGLLTFLRQQDIAVLEAEILHPERNGGIEEKLHGVLSRLARVVFEARKQGQFPLIIGGDHSSAIGTWAGVREALNGQGNLGLLWIDAHMDSHTPHTSPSGALHGMPLACLLGEGEGPFIQIGGKEQKILPKQTCLVGVRSFEKEEQDLLQELGVQIFYMQDIRRLGMAAVMQEALSIVKQDTVGFGVSIDIDAFDPSLAPGTGTPEAQGLNGDDLQDLIDALHNEYQDLMALEVVEFNPNLDKQLVTQEMLFALLRGLLNHAQTN